MEGTVETFNRQFDKDKLEVFKERVESLRKENDILKAKHEKSAKETHEFVAYFQREMEKKDDIIAILNETVIQKDTDSKRFVEELEAKYEQKISRLEETNDGNEGTLRTRLKVVEDELAKLEAFGDKKATLEKKLEVMAEELKQTEVKHIEELNAMERKYLEEKSRLVKETEKRIIDIKTQSREAAQSGLDADTRKIVTDNRRMGEELRFQVQTTTELRRDKTRLEDEAKRLNREVVLYAEKERVYAKQGHRQTKEIKELQNKVKSLERSLSQVVRDFEKERQALINSTHKELEEQTLDAQALRNLVKLKNKELKTVKKLAQTILDQRTEVEQYFLEALEQVKAEKRREKEDNRRRALSDYRKQMRDASLHPNVKFPSIRPTNSSVGSAPGSGPGSGSAGAPNTRTPATKDSSQLPTAPDMRVDLRDLSWEDREHVLRLLFAKINNVQGFVDVAPSHSFEVGAVPPGGGAYGGSMMPTNVSSAGGGYDQGMGMQGQYPPHHLMQQQQQHLQGYPQQPLLNNPPTMSPATMTMGGFSPYPPNNNNGSMMVGGMIPGGPNSDVFNGGNSGGLRPAEMTTAGYLDSSAAVMPNLQ